MTLQHLIYAIEVYKSGSISRAAQNLYMAQPNLSTAIRELENELGAPIFRRTPKGIELTEGGQSFIQHASDIVTRFNYLENMHRVEGKRMSTLSLITARSSEACISMAQYINDLSAQGLPFRIKMRENTNYDVISDVVSGDADIGIVRANTLDAEYFFKMAAYKGLKILRLPPCPYVVLFSRKHPLAKHAYITQEMLKPYIEVVHGDYEMPMYPFSNYKYQDFGKDRAEKNVLFVYDRGTLMDILANVQGSYLWTTTTHPILKKTYDLVERQCDAPPVEGLDAIVYDTHRPITPEMREFINILLQKSGLPPLS